jgi:hypothetical protein
MKSIFQPVNEDMLLTFIDQLPRHAASKRPTTQTNTNELMPPPPPKLPNLRA